MNFKKNLILFFLLFSLQMFAQQSLTFPIAKFKTGDSPEWKQLNFDDSQWATIKTTVRWEEQGYLRYNGYAWYRIKFTLPSSMLHTAVWKDSLSFLMTKVDDVDETFLNGVKIGQTGSLPTDAGGAKGKWSVNRIYNLAANNPIIHWGKENVIAVRVYDISDKGGMFGEGPVVRMMTPRDVVGLTILPDSLTANKFNASILNKCAKVLDGEWTVALLEGADHNTAKLIIKKVSLKPFEKLMISIEGEYNARLEAVASFKEKESGMMKTVSKLANYILTPQSPKTPRINGASVFGVRSGSPFLFKVAATGLKPMRYTATHLPEGLVINESTGIIAGKTQTKGDFKVLLTVENPLGKDSRTLTIKVGDLLALTPPMGWNSWYSWGIGVTDEKVRMSAKALLEKGLIDHGWVYINVDDGWQNPKRAKDSTVIANEKFPDMKLLSDWLHGNGLKFGIYSSPGTLTCGGYMGSLNNEKIDAEIYNKWGVDYLKYDWCSYDDKVINDTSLVVYQKPYKLMQTFLREQPRDIVYSLCQYGLKNVWKWGASVDGNCWRTTNDIKDNWESVVSIGFNHPELYNYAQPGHWNDPDMLVVGKVGLWAGKPVPTQLSADEQYSQMSLWCLLSAPLLIGGDLGGLDDFTLNLLTNDEVLAIDQDALGKPAQQKIKTDKYQVWVKELEDGNIAIGVFNMSDDYQDIHFNFSDLDIKENCSVRDLWIQQNIVPLSNGYSCKVASHGVSLVKLIKSINK